MSRSALIPSALVCLGFAMAGVAPSHGIGQPAAAPPTPSADLATTVRTLEQRVATIERQLAAQMKQESLGPGLISFPSVTANLRDQRLNRYLRLRLILAIEDGQKQAVLDALSEVRPLVKDWLLSHLTNKTVDDIRGGDNLNRIREEILAGINSEFKSAGHPEYITAVLFDEFNVQ